MADTNWTQITERLSSSNKNALYADGFQEALVGILSVLKDGKWEDVAVYNRDRCIEILMENSPPLDEEGAEEYFDFNVEGAYVGRGTPVFVPQHILDRWGRWSL